MEIFHIGAECYPVAKVGGLADVIGALPKYQSSFKNQVRVVIPSYETTFRKENNFECVHWGKLKLGTFNFPFTVQKETSNKLGFELYLIEIPELFDRPNVYNYKDDIERFVSFQIATLDWIIGRNSMPDIIHCHDHHTGLIPFMKKFCPKYEKIKDITTLITIHNSLYQGIFTFNKLYYLPEFDLVHIKELEWENYINSLASGIKCADAITTVSPSYLNEINYTGSGLETLYQRVRDKSKGILNGIDLTIWNPEKDFMINTNYSNSDFYEGKQRNKEELCLHFGMNPAKPLFSFIGRLYNEKGADLLSKVVQSAMATLKEEINILILGYGDTEIENQLTQLLPVYKGNYSVYIGYNEELAHKTYAGSDFIMIPSRVEPCGLNQMYALRYGTIPIVRRTGGLRDTISDFEDNGNGICHEQPSAEDVCDAIDRAVNLYKDKDRTNALRIKGMNTDHSWENVSQEYLELYNLIIAKKYES
ncbi:glycogen synthase [Flavobacterium gilvum]|uniref:Glycogen synthase n=1 Tax=Flavobacterium gilvum TaxID=1492737 RepID=A0AAC9I4F1_9FLAO|nr:glycogen synthase [Flavobacterium gilvum]AOW10201.1 glycogen synthase [Flavobacterium gilvum]KFC58627.1 glycogen synthase [Flavobacterium gilvum]